MEEIILKERETREKIAQVINEAQLPAFILKPIFKDFYDQLNNIEAQQYNEALTKKEKSEKGGKK